MVIVLKAFLSGTHFIYDFGYPQRLMASVQALSAVLIGGSIYVSMIIKTNLLTEAELSLLPFGSKLMVFLPKKNRRGRVHEKD
jgi:hypothetical protein